MNFLGIDVGGLHLPAFFFFGKVAFISIYLFWVLWIWRAGRIRWGWAPIFLALMGWAWTTYPLPGIWGLAPVTDRLRILQWCATASAGNAPWESGILGQAPLEPLWAILVSFLSLRDPGLVLRIYPFLPALAIILFGLSLQFTFGVAAEGVAPTDDRSKPNRQQALIVLFFALLVAAPPLDFLGVYNGSVAKMFLHKPNHALGLALVPLCLWLLARALSKPTFVYSALAALCLGALGWAFIIYWVLLCTGVVLGGLLIGLVKSFGTLQIRLGVILLVALVLVAPYMYYLTVNFPHAVSLSAGETVDLRSPWDEGPPRGRSLLFLATLDLGLIFYLGVYGAWTAWRKRRRSDLLWLGLLAAVYGAWFGSILLYATARSRGAVHVYTLLVVVMAIFSGLGVYDLISQMARKISDNPSSTFSRLGNSTRLTAAVILLLLPSTLPWWWEQERMDNHFRLGLTAIPRPILTLGEWIRENTEGSDVFLAGKGISVWIPVVSGRRVLRLGKPSFDTEAYWDECAIVDPNDPDQARKVAARLGVTYIVADASFATEHVLTGRELARHPLLEEVYQLKGIKVYRIAARSSPDGISQ